MNLHWDGIPHGGGIDSDLANAYEKSREGFVNSYVIGSEEIYDLLQKIAYMDDETDVGNVLSDVFLAWRESGAMSLPRLFLTACEFFEINETEPLYNPALTACVLGEINHGNSYHNNHHFREVFVVVMCLCAKHNNAPDQAGMLSSSDILLVLTAAAIHDLAHDGKTNIPDTGGVIPSRLERQSVAGAAPFLKVAGITDDHLAMIEAMVVCTDVTQDMDVETPAAVARAVYKAHMNGEQDTTKVDAFYDPLVQSYKLSLLTRFLGEADIIPSSGLTYEFSKLLTRQITNESGKSNPSASVLLGFFEVICTCGYDTAVSKEIFGDNFDAILSMVRADTASGVVYR